MPLQQELKNATAQLHAELEQLMFVNQIMDKTLTQSQYAQLLMTNFIVYNQLEPKISSLISDENKKAINLPVRLKTTALAKDLAELKIDDKKLDGTFAKVGDFMTNANHALGALYVLEGSSIGGQVIYKKLAVNNYIPHGLGFYFYNHYGEQTMPLWKHFVGFLNAQEATATSDAIEGAIKTFETIKSIAKTINSTQLIEQQPVSDN